MEDNMGVIEGIKGMSPGIEEDYSIKSREDLIGEIKNLKKMAFYDSKLTQLGNQRFFEFELSRAMAHTLRSIKGPGEDEYFSTLLMDLDNMKEVNDNLGHLMGDQVLYQTQNTILSTLQRKTDSAYRVGGDEFIILLPNTTLENGFNFAERLRYNIEQRLKFEDIQVTASIGVSNFVGTSPTGESLIEDADTAMYFAKKTGGRNAVAKYDPSMEEPVLFKAA